MCGEHLRPCVVIAGLLGSSPHVRGALLRVRAERQSTGIIPACAGSTMATVILLMNWRDHPRMCGEHYMSLRSDRIGAGSSPHVRGAPASNPLAVVASGIIPACAGSTAYFSRYSSRSRDHPRMCGEHFDAISALQRTAGSSPHVRGALHDTMHDLAETGIIPACAGSTSRFRGSLRRAWDHPRMCGEHGTCVHERFEHLGSSPHVRGARFILRLPADCLGIIPACAGSTLPDASGMTGRGDHPRMCGEHPMQELVNERAPGSSPHVRGAPCGSDSCHPQAGIIPACAGSTLHSQAPC